MSIKIKLEKVRLSFPVLWTAEDYQNNKRFRYSASFIITPGSEQDKTIQAAIVAAAGEKWPTAGKSAAMLEGFRGQTNKMCYVKGDLKDYEGYAGNLILTGHRQQVQGRPLILGPDIDPLTNELRRYQESDGRPYAGCYVNASAEIYAQDGENKGMRCGLLVIQFHSDGDAFSGATKPSADDFGALSEGAGAPAAVGSGASLV